MSPLGLLLVGVSALLTVAANLLLRGGVARSGVVLSPATLVHDCIRLATQPFFVTGTVFYVAAALVWFRVISTEQLTSSYPLLVSLTFVLVTIGAVVFLHESLSLQKVAGLGVILTGILIVARG